MSAAAAAAACKRGYAQHCLEHQVKVMRPQATVGGCPGDDVAVPVLDKAVRWSRRDACNQHCARERSQPRAAHRHLASLRRLRAPQPPKGRLYHQCALETALVMPPVCSGRR